MDSTEMGSVGAPEGDFYAISKHSGTTTKTFSSHGARSSPWRLLKSLSERHFEKNLKCGTIGLLYSWSSSPGLIKTSSVEDFLLWDFTNKLHLDYSNSIKMTTCYSSSSETVTWKRPQHSRRNPLNFLSFLSFFFSFFSFLPSFLSFHPFFVSFFFWLCPRCT